MLKKVALGIVAIVAVILIYVAVQPKEYVISREITINASVDKVFPFLNSQKLSSQWGPWMEIDPDAKMTFSEVDVGVGSKTSWTGGKQLGTGSATITEVVPNERVRIALEYTEPMKMEQTSDYMVKSSGEQTTVVWRVEGKNSFSGRLMCMFVNMDKHVGGFFEKGLNNLKNLVEKGSR